MFKQCRAQIAFITLFAFVLGQLAPMAWGQAPQAGGKGQKTRAGMSAETFNVDELEKNWEKYTKDRGFSALLEEAKKQGFQRIANNERTEWGFKADIEDQGKQIKAEVCGFDFYKETPQGIQMASMVWRDSGTEIYKCLIVFPVGETNRDKAMAAATETTVGPGGGLQKANSFKSCFNACVINSAAFCGAALAGCATISAAIALASGGTITTPFAIAIFATCAGLCLFPLAVCAVRCN